MRVLSPDVVAAIDDLDLAARLVVEGLRAGEHRSPFHGYSAEFQQHRPYRAGDDLKYLDWKLLARTDRLYSKQFRETTSMSVMLVLDTSASMAYPRDAEGVSKFRYATMMAAALAYLIVAQGDAVGLMTMQRGALSYVPARGGRPHLRLLLARLDALEPAGTWAPARVITRGAELLKRRGLVMVASDFYDDEDETRRALRRVARRGHDVAMLQVVAPGELELPRGAVAEFEDAESGARRLIEPASAAGDYRAAMTEFLARCAREARRHGIEYDLLRTDVAPSQALRMLLLRRGAHGGRQHGHAARMEIA